MIYKEFSKFLFVLIFLSGCSTQYLTKEDYGPSLKAFSQSSPEAALEQFPKGKEEGTFIVSLEQAYLNLLQGKAELKMLEHYSELQEERFRVVISDEIKTFFYFDTPEGYYASEHEVVWLHFLLSWGYSLEGKPEQACVEARKSAHLLSAPWSNEGHFDDPSLRLFLAGLWSLCGSWDDAKVDFKKAWMLDPSLTWAKKLSEMPDQPRNLYLLLGGIGQKPFWNAKKELNLLRGARNISFRPQGQRSQLWLERDEKSPLLLHLSPDSSQWYQRHVVRNNAMNELISDSHYGAEATLQVAKETGKVAAATAWGTTAAVGGVAVGAGVGYVGGLVLAEGEIELGVFVLLTGATIATSSVEYGTEYIEKAARQSKRDLGRNLDASRSYRFVRYLPEYLWIGWDNQQQKDEISLYFNKKESRKKIKALKSGPTRVFIGHLPDTLPSGE